jgi:hypothetical protein
MQIDVIPTLIDQFRETFEGEVQPGVCWIIDGRADAALFGTLQSLTAEQAFTPPVAGAHPIAAHAEHLRFSLELTWKRLQGENPEADWAGSFRVSPASDAAWESLQSELRRAYERVLEWLQQRRDVPPEDWVPLHLAGIIAIIAHNAYHLSAIRQIAQVVRHGHSDSCQSEGQISSGQSVDDSPRKSNGR